MGLTLLDHGNFVAVLTALEEAHRLGRLIKGWRYASGASVKRCQDLSHSKNGFLAY